MCTFHIIYSTKRNYGYISLLLILILFYVSCKPANKPIDKEQILCSTSKLSFSLVQDLPPPRIIQQIGDCNLEITSSSDSCVFWVRQGIMLLHCFWHFEAYRAFKYALHFDPKCAMSYWGMSMCGPGFGLEENIWNTYITKAHQLSYQNTEIEKALIEATVSLIGNGISNPNTQKSFQSIAYKFPNNPDIIAFAGLVMRQNEVVGKLESNDVKEFLLTGMKKFDNHVGLMHYYLHLMETRHDFIEAFPAINKIKAIAAGAPHMLHMPGHIQYLMQDYKAAIKTFETAYQSEKKYHMSQNIPFPTSQNMMHNMQYLSYAHAQNGDLDKSIFYAKQIMNFTIKDKKKDYASLLMKYQLRMIPAFIYIKFEKYKNAAQHINQWINHLDFPMEDAHLKVYFNAMYYYCLGMDAIQSHQMDNARKYGKLMNDLVVQYRSMLSSITSDLEFSLSEKNLENMTFSLFELAGWIDNFYPENNFNDYSWNLMSDIENHITFEDPPRFLYTVAERKHLLTLFRKNKTHLGIRPNEF